MRGRSKSYSSNRTSDKFRKTGSTIFPVLVYFSLLTLFISFGLETRSNRKELALLMKYRIIQIPWKRYIRKKECSEKISSIFKSWERSNSSLSNPPIVQNKILWNNNATKSSPLLENSWLKIGRTGKKCSPARATIPFSSPLLSSLLLSSSVFSGISGNGMSPLINPNRSFLVWKSRRFPNRLEIGDPAALKVWCTTQPATCPLNLSSSLPSSLSLSFHLFSPFHNGANEFYG